MPDELTPEAVLRAWAEGLVRGIGSVTNVPLSRAVLSLFARHERALGLLREMPDHWGVCPQWSERRNALLAETAGRPPDKGELCQCDHCRGGAPPTTAGRLTTMDNDIAALERRMAKVEQGSMPIETSSDVPPMDRGRNDWNTPETIAGAEALIEECGQESILEERVAELEAWRSDVDGREQARLDAIFEPSSQQRATSLQEWHPGTEHPSYDPQDIEHRVLVAEGHAVPFGDGWLLKPHRWHECAPDAEDGEDLATELLQIAQEPSLREIAGGAGGDEESLAVQAFSEAGRVERKFDLAVGELERRFEARWIVRDAALNSVLARITELEVHTQRGEE